MVKDVLLNSTVQEDKQRLNGNAVKPYMSHGWGSWVPLQLSFGYCRGSTEGRSDEDGSEEMWTIARSVLITENSDYA